MEKISTLSDDHRQRILSKVSFDHRFVGGKLRRHGGIKRVTSYSFNEVVSLLNDEMPMIHFSALEQWVKEVIKDRELAGKIAEAINKQKGYRNTYTHGRRQLPPYSPSVHRIFHIIVWHGCPWPLLCPP